jgi:predicted nucleic acid-binding protein
MIVYLDSSVILRKVLGEPGALEEWPDVERGVTSALTEVESLRTIDRLRLDYGLADEEVARRRSAVLAVLEALEIVELDAIVLARAVQPLPTRLGTLDAIHLASALLWREGARRDGRALAMASHDAALAVAAQAVGFRTLGEVVGASATSSRASRKRTARR